MTIHAAERWLHQLNKWGEVKAYQALENSVKERWATILDPDSHGGNGTREGKDTRKVTLT